MAFVCSYNFTPCENRIYIYYFITMSKDIYFIIGNSKIYITQNSHFNKTDILNEYLIAFINMSLWYYLHVFTILLKFSINLFTFS